MDNKICQLQDDLQAEQDNIEKAIMLDKKFDYQLIQQSSYKQKEFCCAFSFNQDGTILVVSGETFIKVFEFKNDKLREVQQLNGHSKLVYCLQFMKISNQFISASWDKTVIIWEFNQNNNLWEINQVLKDHESRVFCALTNQNDDLLVTGSKDSKIKFWGKQNNLWSCNQSIDCENQVQNVSLSNQGDNLIAGLTSSKLLVLKLQGKEWIIIQRILVEEIIEGLCYINQDQFLLKIWHSESLQIFNYDPKDQAFKKEQELQYPNKGHSGDCIFPICNIPLLRLIIVQEGDYVYLIKRSQDGQFSFEQSIDFGINSIFGCISKDGRYIATWDIKSEEIQIRKFEF